MIKKNGNNEIKTLSHSTYRCQYHIVFAPKYHRKVIYGKIKKDIGEIIRKLCEQKGVEIIEAEACKDHIHLLISIPPYISVAQFMGYLKGKSTLMIFDRSVCNRYLFYWIMISLLFSKFYIFIACNQIILVIYKVLRRHLYRGCPKLAFLFCF